MTGFIIRFLICNVFISVIICILFVLKYAFRNALSGRMQYNLWYVLLVLLIVPFLSLHLPILHQPVSFLNLLTFPSDTHANKLSLTAAKENLSASNWINDFTVSVSNKFTSNIEFLLYVIWILGILVLCVFMIRSSYCMHLLKKSALPLQNTEVHILYKECLAEMNIRKYVPVYSTAFLRSPIITGFLKPEIYLPIHLISDYNPSEMRYMLLHELQHYKYKDTLANYLMNLAGIFYWFNPFVWRALKEMRNEREIACDSSVLQLIEKSSYIEYGNTLLNFAEKLSRNPFPFSTSLSGNAKQLKRRIINISAYENPDLCKKVKSSISFALITVILLGLTPSLSTYAADDTYYQWNSSSERISQIDCSSSFGAYEGSFVLYDSENDIWKIHDLQRAALRTSPDSTYKIYDALFGLEEQIITPENSLQTWNNEIYPFEEWNSDHTLKSAMNSSVNWYFQKIDKQLGAKTIRRYLQKIHYGNLTINEDLSTYWLESSLKISPIEQVELLTKLHNNSLGFSMENVNAVKESLRISSSDNQVLYGKTGTGRINDQDVNGWFVGYIETSDNTYFFAVNIGAKSGATGSKAAKTALSILSEMNIW